MNCIPKECLKRKVNVNRVESPGVALLILFSLLLVMSACNAPSAKIAKIEPAHTEPIEGTDFKLVVLTEKAAERLGIQTVSVREEQVSRKRRVGGRVLAFPAVSAMPDASGDTNVNVADTANAGGVLVRVRLNESDLNMVDRSQPALILPLDGDAGGKGGVMARVVPATVIAAVSAGNDDREDEDEGLYYEIDPADRDDEDHGFVPGQPVFVELSLLGGGTPRKIIPYAAVLYGLHGETWVYTSSESLAFVRQPISIDYIDGDLAFLLEGPPAGTAVVTVGGAELYGTETGVSK